MKLTFSIAVHTSGLAKNHFCLVVLQKERIGEQLIKTIFETCVLTLFRGFFFSKVKFTVSIVVHTGGPAKNAMTHFLEKGLVVLLHRFPVFLRMSRTDNSFLFSENVTLR